MRFWESAQLRTWLDQFPDEAICKKGIGDLSIFKDWESMRELHRGRSVKIWSLDAHLSSFSSEPEL